MKIKRVRDRAGDALVWLGFLLIVIAIIFPSPELATHIMYGIAIMLIGTFLPWVIKRFSNTEE